MARIQLGAAGGRVRVSGLRCRGVPATGRGVMAETKKEPSPLQVAAVCLSSHDTAWENLRTKAHLHGWVAARARGLDVDTCDAIVNAALAGMRLRLTEWAEETTDRCTAVHPRLGARCVQRAKHVDDGVWHYCGDGDDSEVWE